MKDFRFLGGRVYRIKCHVVKKTFLVEVVKIELFPADPFLQSACCGVLHEFKMRTRTQSFRLIHRRKKQCKFGAA